MGATYKTFFIVFVKIIFYFKTSVTASTNENLLKWVQENFVTIN